MGARRTAPRRPLSRRGPRRALDACRGRREYSSGGPLRWRCGDGGPMKQAAALAMDRSSPSRSIQPISRRGEAVPVTVAQRRCTSTSALAGPRGCLRGAQSDLYHVPAGGALGPGAAGEPSRSSRGPPPPEVGGSRGAISTSATGACDAHGRRPTRPGRDQCGGVTARAPVPLRRGSRVDVLLSTPSERATGLEPTTSSSGR